MTTQRRCMMVFHVTHCACENSFLCVDCIYIHFRFTFHGSIVRKPRSENRITKCCCILRCPCTKFTVCEAMYLTRGSDLLVNFIFMLYFVHRRLLRPGHGDSFDQWKTYTVASLPGALSICLPCRTSWRSTCSSCMQIGCHCQSCRNTLQTVLVYSDLSR